MRSRPPCGRALAGPLGAPYDVSPLGAVALKVGPATGARA
jgi:hypothetical protein